MYFTLLEEQREEKWYWPFPFTFFSTIIPKANICCFSFSEFLQHLHDNNECSSTIPFKSFLCIYFLFLRIWTPVFSWIYNAQRKKIKYDSKFNRYLYFIDNPSPCHHPSIQFVIRFISDYNGLMARVYVYESYDAERETFCSCSAYLGLSRFK